MKATLLNMKISLQIHIHSQPDDGMAVVFINKGQSGLVHELHIWQSPMLFALLHPHTMTDVCFCFCR